MKRFETAEKNENKDGNGVFWRYLKRFETVMSRLVGAHPSPHWSPILLYFWIFLFEIFLEKVVGPGLQCIHVATSVHTIASSC